MSMFRQCRRVPTAHETLEFPGSKRCSNTLEFCAASNAGTVSQVARYCPSSSVTRVIIHMNTKMILAALALSLSLTACQKKTEEAPPADAAAPAETAPAPDAAASGDPNAASSDAAGAAAPSDQPATPPADQPPAQPPQQ